MPQLQRRAAAITQGPIDWATAEILAFGSLLMEGRTVRLTGQDSRRGTFVQRFASVVDRVTGESWVPLKHLDDEQGKFHIFDSLLSEYAAMGFEYGYSVARPEALVLWEAQFGDFANGAQTIIDEFISSGQAKWTQKSGVVLLLPHGYEGQGPDHSSARIERWLQLAAEDSITVGQPSTPASHFHMLRQQALGEMHRPLIVMTPKSMLRNKLAVSEPADFTERTWRPVLRDPVIEEPGAVKRVILCSGKVRWDLVNKRAQLGLQSSVAILPMERLYPLPAQELAARARPVPPGGPRDPLGAGRTRQPGRLALHGAQPARRPARGRSRTTLDDQTRSPGPLRRHHRWVRPRCTNPSSASCWKTRSASSAPGVLHRPGHRGARDPTGRRRGHPGVARRAAADLRGRAPRLRGAHRAAGHLAGPTGRRGLNRSLWGSSASRPTAARVPRSCSSCK